MNTPVLIIGAGPAGLAVAAQLRDQNIDFEVLEKSDKIAFAWHNHYDRLCLHTVKEFSNLPLMEFPDDYPEYVPRATLVEYFERYAKHFKIEPHFNQEVSKVTRNGDGWVVKTKAGLSVEAEQVIVATGVNRIPHQPVWKGQDNFEGEIVHSRNYKNPQPFIGKRVLVIGFGNTGAELALDLAEHDVDTTVSIRSAVSIVPRDLNGRPVQKTAIKLAKLPFGLGDWLGTQIRKIYFGDLSKYGIPQSKVHPAVQLRETGKTPVIDLGTIKEIKKGKIKVVGDLENFLPKGVQLKTGEELEFDSIILSTGYRAKLEDFIPSVGQFLDSHALPKQ
ncbi:MAG: NAD(P)/FAD-dependent oxidoreductase, partial [Bacteroidota bacterium]